MIRNVNIPIYIYIPAVIFDFFFALYILQNFVVFFFLNGKRNVNPILLGVRCTTDFTRGGGG